MMAILWSLLVLLPQASVAVQVRVIVSSCGQVPTSELSLNVITGSASQLSVAVAEPVLVGSKFSASARISKPFARKQGVESLTGRRRNRPREDRV